MESWFRAGAEGSSVMQAQKQNEPTLSWVPIAGMMMATAG